MASQFVFVSSRFTSVSKFEWHFTNSSVVLVPNDSVKARFSAPFQLSYTVTLAAHQLTSHLNVKNPSETSVFSFQALLHTYIHTEVATSTVTPLKGLTYINKLKPGLPEEVETRDEVDVKEPADYVYKQAGGVYKVVGNGQGILLRSSGFSDVVIWNPGLDGRSMSDLAENGWYVSGTCMPVIPDSHHGFLGIILSVLNPERLRTGLTWHLARLGMASRP